MTESTIGGVVVPGEYMNINKQKMKMLRLKEKETTNVL